MARNFLLLVFFISNLFGSDDFVIWAKISTQNNRVIHENISISKALELKGLQYKFLCEIDKKKDENQTTIAYLNRHKNEIFDCFFAEKFKVEDDITKGRSQISATTTITMMPVRFTIEFKQNSAIISRFLDKADR